MFPEARARAARHLSCCVVLACGALTACEGGAPTPTDTLVLPPAVVFEAVPDPAEERGCAAPVAAGAVRAKHVECDAELLHGPLAMGREGDVLLENEHVRFIVRGGDESATMIGGFSGGLVDAERVGGIDRLKELFPLLDLATTRPSALEVVAAGGDGEARVRLLFSAAPLGLLDTVAPGASRARALRGAVDYVLGPADRALRIEVRVTTEEGTAAAAFTPGVGVLIGGGMELCQPGVGLLGEDEIGGAGLPALLAEGADEALAVALAAGGAAVEPGSLVSAVSINLLSAAGRAPARQGEVTTFVIRVAPAAIGADAWNAAIADTTAPTLTLAGEPDARVELRDAEGRAMALSRLDGSGAARLHLPAGTYTAAVGFGGSRDVATLDATLATDRTLPLPHVPRATLRVEALAGGEAAPVRVTVLDAAGSEVARFVAIGPSEHDLEPGSYHVAVSRGLEHDVHEEDATLLDGETTVVTATLARAIDTTGYVGADFHLHSELSTDSRHRVDAALRMIAAEGLELVASTDHDFLTDYGALAEDAGVAPWLVTIVGEEVSSTVYGHLGGYPLARDTARAGSNAVVWLEASLLESIAGIRARGDVALGGAIVQLNHPRLRGGGTFDYLALDGTGAATADPAALGLPAGTDLDALDADVVEVWNGYTRGDNEASFADWLALRARGRALTMVGNSDSHRPDLPAGSPRTFLRVADDSRGAFGWAEAGAALRAGDATVAGGLFVTAEIAGVVAGASVPVHVVVQAPPWADATRLRIYAGTTVAIDRPIPASTAAVRLDETIDVPLGGASFVVVRAEGARAPEPFLHFAPFGVTNAIEVP